MSALLEFWPYIAGLVALAFGAWKLRQSGAKAERAKQDRARLDAIEEANEIGMDVHALPEGEARDELNKWGKP
jgi:hypothetical protein